MDSDAYLLELARYVVLNPVRAGKVAHPEEWPWSSYRASAGLEAAPFWLPVDGLLAQFSDRRSLAQERYAQFVAEGINVASPWVNLKGQVFLGDEKFVKRMQAQLGPEKEDVQIPKAQRRLPPPPLSEIERRAANRNTAIVMAYATGGYSYQAIADYFGVHFTTVGKIIRGAGKAKF